MWDSTSLQIPPENSEALGRYLCALALAGVFVPYGAAAGINHAFGGFLREVGVQHLHQLVTIDEAVVSQAVWVHLRCVPERTVEEATRIIHRTARALAVVHNDISSVVKRDAAGLRKFTQSIVTDEPVPALGMMLAMGRDDARPIPSSGAASLLCHIGAVDWCEGLLGGRQAIRLAALDYLQHQPSSAMFAVEDWGGVSGGCPEACVQCCLIDACDALTRGLI